MKTGKITEKNKTGIFRREILQILPELSILDGEILDSSESRRTSKSSTKNSINSDETICIPK